MDSPMINTLVIGGTGFVGSHLIPQLIATGRSVTVLARNSVPRCELPANVNYIEGDFAQADLIGSLPDIIEMNPENDVFLVPRVNTVEGLTDDHIKKWGWNVNEDGWVNWPDYQWRVWKNTPTIKWVNKVHERLHGFKTFSQFILLI